QRHSLLVRLGHIQLQLGARRQVCHQSAQQPARDRPPISKEWSYFEAVSARPEHAVSSEHPLLQKPKGAAAWLGNPLAQKLSARPRKTVRVILQQLRKGNDLEGDDILIRKSPA